MSQHSPRMRAFAERVIAQKSSGVKSAGIRKPGGFPELEELRPVLTGLMGVGGLCALFSRALALAKEEAGWLERMRVSGEGTLEDWGGMEQMPVEEVKEGRVILLSRLLGLLEVFIGETLTMQIVREAWPNQEIDGGEPAK